MNDNFAEEYRQFLLSSIPTARSASGDREVLCRCFYCPDSDNPKHAHFYISIPKSPDEPSMYHCKKCPAQGYVTHRTLLDWGIWDDQVAIDLIEHNKNTKVKAKDRKLTVFKLANTITTESETSKIKLQYINNRIGTNYSYEDLRKLKIVLNLNDVLSVNHIENFTRANDIIAQLDANFLGFISIDNAFLNMRRLCDEGLVFKSIDKRYINYNIFNKFDTSQRFYTIPTQIDLYQIPTKIHIAEGPFDILSIYENVRHKEPGIYTSIGGANYMGIIMYMLETFKLPSAEIHIYPDNDNIGNDRKMRFIYDRLKIMNIPVYIHRNQYPNEKDFGVAPDHIKEQIIYMGDLFI